jgi:gluconokinase
VVPRVLALDVGSSSVRAWVYDETATPVPDAGAKRRYRLEPGGVLDPDRLLRDALAVLHEVGGEHAGPEHLVAASCFWHSLLAVDGAGRPLTPLMTWRDVRSAVHAEELTAQVDAAGVLARTGCPVHASFWPAKLRWLAAEEPQAFRDADRFVGFADWLLWHETGELRTSVSMASGTGLWTDDGWDDELLRLVGLDEARLPPVSDDQVGAWYPAFGDGACSNLGSGCTTAERAALNVGTSAAVRIVTESSAPPPPGLFRYRVDARRSLVGGSLSTGGNLHRWLEEMLRLPQARELASRPPAGHGLTFVPLLAGERAPGWDATRRGAISGLTFETTALDVLQAGLEGVALELRRVTDLLPAVDEIVVSGGTLVDKPDWLQIVADVLERPLAVSAEPEASARGAAVAVLERLGLEPPPPPVSRVATPRRDRAEAYRSAMERHLRLMRGAT